MHAHHRIKLIGFVLILTASSFAGTTFQATTTLTAEITNNTSTANTFLSQTNGNPGATNVSKVTTRSLLYAGSTAKIFAHLVVWFGFGTNMDVGYTSSDPTQVHQQVTDMISRGIQGTIIDWYGQGTLNPSFVNYDQATQVVMKESQQHSNFSFAIMDDGGSLKACSQTTGCSVTQTLINDLTYAYNSYETSPAYLYYNNRPVVYFFGQEFYNIDWSQVRNSVPGNPLFIFRNTEGFSYAQSNGAFAWVDPENVTSTDPMALNYMGTFDSQALSLLPTYSNVAGFKGFNDTLASWTQNRIIQQQCGQTWLQSVTLSGNYFSTVQQMLGIQLVTWNDYEEGTEIESGIDNCVTVTGSANGTVVSWSIAGPPNTLDHYTVFLSQDGQNLMWLADVPTNTNSLDLAQFNLTSGSYIVFVKAVGKPSITNKMSAGVSVTIPITNNDLPPVASLSVTPLSGYSPLAVTASTAHSYDPDGTIASSTIAFGDGTSAPGPNASHTYSIAGTYMATATVIDNAGLFSSTSATVAVKPPEVIVSSPTSGVTTTSPVHVVATGFSGYPVTAMQIYLDYNLIYTVQSANLDTYVTTASGGHLLVVKGWDSSGRSFMTSLNITIANLLSAALSVSPGSILAGASVTASTAGSTGNIVATQINFGDGTIVKAASATHRYAGAGTYTVTATVTDTTGASAIASTTVAVNPQHVVIASPTGGLISSATVEVSGTAYSGYAIRVTRVYLDGVLKYQASASSVNTSLRISLGGHVITVQASDASGARFSASVSFTRQ